MIKVYKNSYTTAQLLAWLVNTDKIILPAPAAGKVNVILGVTSNSTYGTIVYNNPSFFYGTSPGSSQYNQNYLNARIDQAFNTSGINAGKINLPMAITEDLVMSPDATPINGNGSLDVIIIYEEKLPV